MRRKKITLQGILVQIKDGQALCPICQTRATVAATGIVTGCKHASTFCGLIDTKEAACFYAPKSWLMEEEISK